MLLCLPSDASALRAWPNCLRLTASPRTRFACVRMHEDICMIRALMAGVVIAVVGAVPSHAAQSPARGPAQKPVVASPRTGSVRIAVRDQDGTSLAGVRLLLSGAGTGAFVTSGAGTM